MRFKLGLEQVKNFHTIVLKLQGRVISRPRFSKIHRLMNFSDLKELLQQIQQPVVTQTGKDILAE